MIKLTIAVFTVLVSLTLESFARWNDMQYPSPPSGLHLPFDIDDINTYRVNLNPFGVVRSFKDRPEYGHSGIDIPLKDKSPLYAVSDGVVIKKRDSTKVGSDILLLLNKNTYQDEGWIFIYESIELGPGIEVGSKIKKGQLIAKKKGESFSTHLQLSYWKSPYYHNHKCWVDNLESEEFKSYFKEEFSQLRNFIDFWKSKDEFKGLLDRSLYSNGPQLCYPLGTDVR